MGRWHKTEFDFLPERAFSPRPGGGMTLEGGGGGGGANNTAMQNYTAMQQIEMSREQLSWAKEIYANETPQREEAARVAQEVSTAQVDQMRQQTNIAARAEADYQSTYRPLEQSMVREAEAYDTPERRAAESAKAVASVEQNLAQQRDATTRESERAGVNPASGRAVAMQSSMDLNAAKIKAGAGNAASSAVEAQGYARKSDAVNLGRNIASQQGTTAALANQQGMGAVASQSSILQNQQTGKAGVQQAYNTGISGMGSAGSQFGSINGQSQAAADAAAGRKSQDTGAAVGAAAMVAAAFIM